MKLSKMVSAVVGSVTLEIDAKAKKMKEDGLDVVGFGAGEPDFDTPAFIKDAAKEALDRGFTKYTPASGMLALKEAVCERLKSFSGLDYTPGQIVISNGAKHSLFNVFSAILDDGDEVIIPAPYWVSYPEIVKMAGGVPVFAQTDAQKGFMLDAAEIRKAVTSRTKAVIINSPCNPTGAVYPKETLEEVAKIALEKDLVVVSDEIYDEEVYEEKAVSIATLGEDIKRNTVIVNGMSKSYAMTGWRIGYTASAPELAKAMGNFQSHATSNPNSIAQYASAAALRSGRREEMEAMVCEFDKRRRYMHEVINNIPGCSCSLPGGAFYIFMNIGGIIGRSYQGELICGSMDFARILLEKSMVAVVPGIAFGADSYVRLSYATSMENIKKGLERICAFAAGLDK